MYDLNGNPLAQTANGQMTRFTYDEEDRLTGVTTPSGVHDTFTYNGLGLRVAKTDSTGSYSYLCDGASPGAPVLWDGHAVYTPGLSENRTGRAAITASSSFFSPATVVPDLCGRAAFFAFHPLSR